MVVEGAEPELDMKEEVVLEPDKTVEVALGLDKKTVLLLLLPIRVPYMTAET